MKLYAYKRASGGKWMIYVHESTLSKMKGKLDNVALCFSEDRTHVAIFPMEYIGEIHSSYYGTWVAGECLEGPRLCFIRDGKMLSVCEICKNYVGCVVSNFRSCKGVPVTQVLATKGDPIIDLSSLTFVGSRYAGSRGYGNLLGTIDLTEEGISIRRKEFQERAQMGAKNRIYKRDVCSKCIMDCRRVRPQPDMAITEDLVKRVYDVYIDVLFDKDFSERLRWCKLLHFGNNGCNLSRSESHFVDRIFTKNRENYDTSLGITLLYNDQFTVSHMGYAAVVAADDIYRFFRPNEHTAVETAALKYSYAYAFSLLLHSAYWWTPGDAANSLSKLVNQHTSSPIAGMYIPGTDTPVVDDARVLTENEIMIAAGTGAEKLLAKRQAIINASQRPVPPFLMRIKRPGNPGYEHGDAYAKRNAFNISAALKGIE